MINLITENWGIIAGALVAVSEALSLIPSIKSNGIIQLILNTLKKK
jgi:hypothetical protein